MKTPTDYLRIEFRASGLTEQITVRTSEASNRAYSQCAKDDLGHYYTLLRLSLPVFTDEEWQVLRETLHGWLATPETVHLLWAEVADSCHDESFVARLRSLSRFEAWAIVDRIQHEEEENEHGSA